MALSLACFEICPCSLCGDSLPRYGGVMDHRHMGQTWTISVGRPAAVKRREQQT